MSAATNIIISGDMKKMRGNWRMSCCYEEEKKRAPPDHTSMLPHYTYYNYQYYTTMMSIEFKSAQYFCALCISTLRPC